MFNNPLINLEEDTNKLPSVNQVEKAFGIEKEVPKTETVKVNPIPEQVVADMAGTSNYEETIEKALSKDEERKRALAEKILNTKQKPSDASKAIHSIINRLQKLRSGGEATAEIITPNRDTNTKNTLSSDLDVANAKELNKQAILQNIGVRGKSYKQAMEEPDSSVYETAKALTKNHPKEAKKLKMSLMKATFLWMIGLTFLIQ